MIEALATLALALYCLKTFIDLGSGLGAAALAAWTRRKADHRRHAIRLEYIDGAGVVVTMADQVPDGVTVCADRYKVREEAP